MRGEKTTSGRTGTTRAHGSHRKPAFQPHATNHPPESHGSPPGRVRASRSGDTHLCRATTTRKEDDIVRCSREVVLDVAGAEIDRPNVGSWSVQHCNRVGPCPCGGAVADKDRHSDHPRRPCAGAHTGSLSRAVGLARSRVKVHPLCVAVEVAPCWHLASEWVEWVHRLSAVGERLCPLTANGLGGRSGASLKCRAAASRNQDDGSGRSHKWPPTLTQRRRRPLCQHCQQDGPHNRHHLRVSEAWTVREQIRCLIPKIPNEIFGSVPQVPNDMFLWPVVAFLRRNSRGRLFRVCGVTPRGNWVANIKVHGVDGVRGEHPACLGRPRMLMSDRGGRWPQVLSGRGQWWTKLETDSP
jgi:hypothetical protein